MNALHIFLDVALVVVLVTLLVLYFILRKKLAYYGEIDDAEAYQASCEAKANAALKKCQTFSVQSKSLNDRLAAQKTQVTQYEQFLGKLSSAAELTQRIERDTARVQQLATTLGNLEHAAKLNAYIQTQDAAIRQKHAELDSMSTAIGSARTVMELASQAKYYENYLAQLKSEVESVEESKSLQEFGFYRPSYALDASEHYKTYLERIRAKQKAMLTAKSAAICQTDWTIDGSKSEGKKMVGQQIKLMLRAFNGECDAAIGKVRYNNAVSLETRIRRSFEQINKLGETKRIYLSAEFCNLKFEELRLVHELQQKKQEEKEEQRLIRDQMREEQKVAKEIEKT